MIANVDDARQAARKRLPRIFFDYVDGAAFGEQSAAANINDFDHWLLDQRVLCDVSSRDLTTSFLGQDHKLPFMLGPVGFAGLLAPRGEILAARAAHEAGVPFCLSNFGIVSLDELRAQTEGPLWFQLYIHKDRDLTHDFVARAERAGCDVLCLTVDTSVGGVRERDNRNGFRNASRLSPRIAWGLAQKPGWCFRMLSAGIPRVGNLDGREDYGGNALEQASRLGRQLDRSFDWDGLKRIRDMWKGKFVVKGILSANDARKAVEVGADGIVVSNHGGRQLDCSPSSISILPEVVDAVGDLTDVLFDGGIRRGSQIVKALALGAKGVLLGRAYAYGLGAGGMEGVRQVMRVLATEVDVTIGHMGLCSIPELREAGRSLLRTRDSLLPHRVVNAAASAPAPVREIRKM